MDWGQQIARLLGMFFVAVSCGLAGGSFHKWRYQVPHEAKHLKWALIDSALALYFVIVLALDVTGLAE